MSFDGSKLKHLPTTRRISLKMLKRKLIMTTTMEFVTTQKQIWMNLMNTMMTCRESQTILKESFPRSYLQLRMRKALSRSCPIRYYPTPRMMKQLNCNSFWISNKSQPESNISSLLSSSSSEVSLTVKRDPPGAHHLPRLNKILRLNQDLNLSLPG